ncbi:MAG: DUF447 domain-containing protein [Candidatus Caldarchaeales archaeon]
MKRGYLSVKDVMPTVSQNIIYEVILTTRSKDGEVNASPMGLIFVDDELSKFFLRVYKETKTHSNLIERRVGVVNITRKPILFIKYLARDKERYLVEEVEDAEVVDVPRLKNMEAYIEFIVEDAFDKGLRTDFLCKVIKVYEGVKILEPYSRAVYALIESAVNISKLEPYLQQGIDVDDLIRNISYCLDVIKKTASGTEFEEYFKILLSSLPERSSSLLKQHLSL